MEPTRHQACHVYEAGAIHQEERRLLTEEPLVIQIDDQPVVTLMRTIGDEVELALGYLLTEGIIRSVNDVKDISLCEGDRRGANVVRVILAGSVASRRAAPSHRRVFSSCSVCGIEQIKEIAKDIDPFSPPAGRLTCDGITALARKMRERQGLFAPTGASHGAAIALRPIDAVALEGAIVREDVGRHNAMDKAVGAAMRGSTVGSPPRGGLDLSHAVLCLSSRLSFEMVAKAARAGIADIVGVSAPTTLAVDLAARLGMFLAGFVRGEAFTVYCGIEALKRSNKT